MGEILTVISAVFWTGIAVGYASAARRGLTMLPFVAVTTTTGAVLSAAVMRWHSLGIAPVSTVALIAMAAAYGVVGQFGMLCSGEAMKASPRHSVITWTILQMAMVVPFLSAVILWRQPAAWYRWAALLPIAGAMALLGPRGRPKAGDASHDGARWTAYLALGFLLLGVHRAMIQETTLRGWEDVLNLRTAISLGAAAAVLWVGVAVRRQHPTRAHWRLGALTGFAVAGCNMAVFFAVDAMTSSGRTYVVFPLALSLSIVFYAIWQFAIGRERPDRRTLTGIVLAAVGSALLTVIH